MNTELCKQALAKVGNPNVLVNLISRRVRQLNAGGGGSNRPLFAETATLGAADIALIEVIEDKMGWEAHNTLEEDPIQAKKQRRRS